MLNLKNPTKKWLNHNGFANKQSKFTIANQNIVIKMSKRGNLAFQSKFHYCLRKIIPNKLITSNQSKTINGVYSVSSRIISIGNA